MKQPLCSVMIPSRWRFDSLIRSVKSWHEFSASPDSFEILVRLHDSDTESMDRQDELTQLGVRVFHGRDKIKPEANNWLWNQLRPHATGIWHQYWSDDMQIFDSGTHWDELLARIPTEGFIVQPEIHKLNDSIYAAHDAGPVPFVPAKCMEKFGFDGVLEPPDTTLDNVLRVSGGWKTYFLKGVGVFHDRHVDRTLTDI